MICENILEAIGNTPMVRLNKMVKENSAEILVKVEPLNVGGSIKTRRWARYADTGRSSSCRTR